MAIREYKCPACDLSQEIILPTSQTPAPTVPCLRCKAEAEYVQFSRVSLALTSFSEAPLDTIIGKQSAERWQMYHDRMETRNKVRTETGSVGLSATGFEEYAPVSHENKVKREHFYSIAQKTGIPEDQEASNLLQKKTS